MARRQRQGGEDELAEGEVGIAVEDLAGFHLLLVPTTVDPQQVADLVKARVRGADLMLTGEVALGRHSRLSGPYELSMEDAVDAGVPMPWTVCYALDAPVEREDPPLPGVDDRDGFAFAFPHGLPWREEGRALHLLVSLARRVRGVVRVAGGADLITPDPDRAVDYTVHAPAWLEPDVLLGIVAREVPTARLAHTEGGWSGWYGPPDEAYRAGGEPGHDQLAPHERDTLHAAADRHDLTAGSPEQGVLDGYAVVAPFGDDGYGGDVEVLVYVAEVEVPAVADQEWANRPFVTYEVRWETADPADRERRVISEAHRAARERVAPVVARVARAIVEATFGVVTDEDGFLVDRYTLG